MTRYFVVGSKKPGAPLITCILGPFGTLEVAEDHVPGLLETFNTVTIYPERPKDPYNYRDADIAWMIPHTTYFSNGEVHVHH